MGTETGSVLQPVLHIGKVFASKRTLLSEKNTKNNHSKGNRIHFVPSSDSKWIFIAIVGNWYKSSLSYSSRNGAALILLRILAGGSENISFLMKT